METGWDVACAVFDVVIVNDRRSSNALEKARK